MASCDSSACIFGLLWEEHQNETHQYHVCQNDEERRQHHRTRRGAADAFGSAADAHALKARNDSNDQTEYCGLEGRRKEIVKSQMLETGIQKDPERHRLGQSV